MNDNDITYIAGIGMITPVGANAQMTSSAVKAGISGYEESEFATRDNESITMSLLPESLFYDFDVELDEGEYFSETFDHIIKMAHIAIQDSLEGLASDSPIPLILGLSEEVESVNSITRQALANNLTKLGTYPVDSEDIQAYTMGRASTIQAIATAKQMLTNPNRPFVMVGASDSYFNFSRLRQLSDAGRLLTENSTDGFAAGEGAGFILLTAEKDKALVVNHHSIVVHPPGLAEEEGHFYSEEAYRGEGLHKAFKTALKDAPEDSIAKIYSSLNGENFWAKELGIATMRHKRNLKGNFQIEHPLDCLGELGSATAPVLVGLAAMDLLHSQDIQNTLVYASSDFSWRGAVKLEKVRAQ